MTSQIARLCLVLITTVIAACEPAEVADDAAARREARLAKEWPVPPPAENEAQRSWALSRGNLILGEPYSGGPGFPPTSVLVLHCETPGVLSVESGLILWTDVPLILPPFDTFVIEGGGVRLHAPMRSQSDGFSAGASGDFKVDRVLLRQLLSGQHLVVRALHIGEPQSDFSEDWADRHPVPPVAERDAFVTGCAAD